jgi:hypothetical protein
MPQALVVDLGRGVRAGINCLFGGHGNDELGCVRTMGQSAVPVPFPLIRYSKTEHFRSAQKLPVRGGGVQLTRGASRRSSIQQAKSTE